MNHLALMILNAYLAANFGAPSINETEWQAYKFSHGKSYDSIEESMRREILTFNKNKVEKFNAKPNKTFEMGINKYSDRTPAEIQKMHGYRMPQRLRSTENRRTLEGQRFLDDILKKEPFEIPDEVDWRKVPGRVSHVKDQGNRCGSCWTFATTGLLEGQELAINSKQSSLIELSEQNLLDCDHQDHGCNGGTMEGALNFIHNEGGIDDEQSYPYEAAENKCRYKKDKTVISSKGGLYLDVDEEQLKQVVAKYGPVAVGIDATETFRHYKKGVLYDAECSNQTLDHGVLVVGYGTDPEAGDYWIVKNSWGPTHGENGYIKMARNNGNMCGIVTAAVISIN